MRKIIITILLTLFTSSLLAKDFYFEITNVIKPNDKYIEMLEDITFKIRPTDDVYMYINSPGGRIDTGFRLINALKQSKAKVHCRVEDLAASMAALISVSCDSLIFEPKSMIMFHLSYYMDDGIKIQLDDPLLHRYVQDYVFPLLTKEEQLKYLKGNDVWVKGEVFKVRWRYKDPYHIKIPFVNDDLIYDIDKLLYNLETLK